MLGVLNCMLNRLTRLHALHRHAVHPKQRLDAARRFASLRAHQLRATTPSRQKRSAVDDVRSGGHGLQRQVETI
jgi:hypothetical protein